jgi:hypothetical protein
MASTGFYLTEASMNSISGLSIQGLSTLNAILGSTESSRAVAAIITLIKDELSKPEAGSSGEVVSYADLMVGTVGFVLLQRWGRRKTQLDFRNAGGEETIWDAVIDDKGFRADVVGTRRKGEISLHGNPGGPPMTFSSPDGEDEFEALERGTLFDAAPDITLAHETAASLTDEEIRERIVSQLPAGARAVVTSETITAKTIKVDIYDAETAHIDPPPGTVMVAERLNHGGSANGTQQDVPQQTVIFRTALTRSSSSDMPPPTQPLPLTAREEEEHADHHDVDDVFMMKSSPKRISIADEPVQIDDLAYPNSDLEDTSPPTPPPNGPMANQKRSRQPVPPHNKPPPTSNGASSRIPQAKTKKEKSIPSHKNDSHKNDKGGVIKKALRTLSPSQSSTAIKDFHKAWPQRKPPVPTRQSSKQASSPVRGQVTPRRPFASLSHGHTPVTSPSLQRATQLESASSYFAVHDRRRDSTVSQTTETYSVHSIESRPGSPTFTRTHTRVVSGLTHAKSDVGLALDETADSRLDPTTTGSVHHRRSRSFVPSLYSMATKGSTEAIILAPKTPVPPRRSIYEDHRILHALILDGKVPGMFPDRHLVRTVRRFVRFASASYGSNFLRIMGLSAEDQLRNATELLTLNVHHEHSSFSTHTGLPPDTILLSSFYDPQGVTGNTDWSPSAISPLIHFITIDDDSKAVVLTCRGTLGFEDVLTDMTCDYDDILWQGRRHKVHKGIHASARRLLGGSGSRIMATIRATLEQYPDYGLVLCGHSLGGAVAAVLAILIAEPAGDGSETAFVTGGQPKLLTGSNNNTDRSSVPPPIHLPAGRPVHVYAYGTPACVSEPLRVATRGLITTIVNNADIVPCLSLGILHDFRTVALHLKTDTTDALGALRARVWQRLKDAVKSSFYNNPKGPPPPENMAGDGLGEDTWAWAALKTLRASMVNDKLVPPGEVFAVETTRVFDRLDPDVAREAVFGPAGDSRDDRTEKLYRALGRPATRVQFKLVRDVEARFGELRFGRDLFGDHSPARYEAALAALENGICED